MYRLVRTAKASPSKVATLRMPWLARRYFNGYSPAGVCRVAISLAREMTGYEDVSVREVGVTFGDFAADLYCRRLTLRLSVAPR